MKSYDVPQMRRGVLGDMAIDCVDTSVKDNKKKLQAKMASLKSEFYKVKTIRANLLASSVGRGTSRVSALKAAQRELANVDIHGLGKAIKAARSEVNGMVSEAQSRPTRKIAQPTKVTELLKSIKANYHETKQKINAVHIEYDALTDAAKEALSDQDKLASKLQLNGKPYIVARAPVIPVTDGYLDFSLAERAGLPVDNIGGYLLLKNQRVIGIGNKEGKALQQVDEILEAMSNVAGQKLSLVTPRAARYKGNLWYWIADRFTLSGLRKAGHGNFKIRDWGLGFTSEV